MRPSLVHTLAVAGVVGGALVGGRVAWRHRLAARTLAGYVLTPPRPVAPVMLMDTEGHPVALSSLGARGAAVVYFGYTHCPDACPLTLADWQKVKRQLGDDARRVRFVFITVDPAHDAPSALREYLRHFDPDFIGLTGTPVALDSAENALLVQPLEDNPMSLDSHTEGFAHQVAVSILDASGHMRAAIPVHTNPRATVKDVQVVLSGE